MTGGEHELRAILEEYKSLRDEILKRMEHRLVILGFAITGVGTVIGLSLALKPAQDQFWNPALVALEAFILVVLIGAEALTTQNTQQMDVISSYIRYYIEPRVSGMGWETRWTDLRRSKKRKADSGGLPLGTSKALALSYAFLTFALFGVFVASSGVRHVPTFALIGVLGLISLFFCGDMKWRWTKGWKSVDWSQVAESNP